MVTIVDYALRKAKEDGREFIALILQGGLSLVQAAKTGNFYATVKQCSIPSTFDEETAKGFIGEKLPGSVQRMSCEVYEWTNQETGEVIELSHRWVYVPEGATLEDAIYEGDPEMTMADQKPKLKFQMEEAL
jgi:ketol-acid reductoisomerase